MTTLSCPRYDVTFGGLLLNTLPYVVDMVDISPAPVALDRFALFTRPGTAVVNSHIEPKMVDLTGRIVDRDRTPMEVAIDRLNRYLYNGRQVLKPGYSDSRFYYAQLLGPVQIDWQEGDARPSGVSIHSPRLAYWQASFLADTAYAYGPTTKSATDNSALSSDGGTAYHKDIVVSLVGSAPNRPRLTLTIPNPSSYGLTNITVTNLTTGDAISIPATFAQGDILIIDGDTYNVSKNNVSVRFDGTLDFLFDPQAGSTNTIRISATATSTPTINCSFLWVPRYA